MKIVCLISLVLLQIVTSPADAVDLSKVPRTIGAEPEYHTQPKYCLLVFGPGAANPVWLVQDGDTLYVDLDGDGDLTEPPERFAAHEDSDPDDGFYRFDVGEVPDGKLLHKSLMVGTMNLQHLAQSDSRVRKILSQDPEARFYRLSIDLQMPLHRGAGIGDRVEHVVGPIDAGGALRFSDTTEDAPIIHFGGPWQITLFSETTLTVGRQTEVFLGMGTPGLGPGTTAFAAYERVVPSGTFPRLHVTLPGNAEKPLEFVLREKCCTINFHGGVRLPDDVPTGEATVKITIDDWLGGSAAPTTHTVQVVKPKFEFALEPVSPRLKGSLMHPSRDGMIVGIRYSPDGSQIVAGDYPGGTIQLWDAETGQELATIETGYGYRSSFDYFHLTPEGKVVSAPPPHRKHTRVERGGKQRIRWEFDGEIRCWDPATGERLWKLQDSPPRGIVWTGLSPNGKYIVSLEELPGEYDGHPDRYLSFWNMQTKTKHEIAGTTSHFVFSADSRLIATGRLSTDGFTEAVEVFNLETGDRTLSIPVKQQSASLSLMDFTPGGSHLIGQVTIMPDPRDRESYKSSLKVWNVNTGEEVSSIVSGTEAESFYGVGIVSPDRKTYVSGSAGRKQAKLYLIDLAARKLSRTVELGEKMMYRGAAFSPDGHWIAAATQSVPETVSPFVTAEDLPQPRIHLIEAATGEVRETIVAPQSFIASLCFSPDGKTLATGGPGRILLWDLSTPPGELAKR